MSEVEESVEVGVPVHTAYSQWSQFATFPRFMEGVEHVDQRTSTLTHWVTSVGGVTREFDALITEQTPDERIAWTTVAGEATQTGAVSFQPLADDRTKVMLRLDFEPEGITENVGDKLGFVKRRAKGDLDRFKEFVESRGSGTLHGAV